MQRFQPPDVRRRQILDAVADLLLADGYDNLTVSRVADRAGVAKGTVYLYFDSKNALIRALQADLWQLMLHDPVATLSDDALTWADRLDRLVAAWVEAESTHADLYHLLFHLHGGGGDPMTGARDVLQAIIEGGVAAGEFHVDDLQVTTDFLLHAYVGPCHHPHIGDITGGVQVLFRRVVGAT
ncbi:hypothetical protein Lfu02_67280 [Longispora fulva]|uniref:AcrR family transcriptional regulator n=1 Tax=Longispora fulva TaxID=619741 RepID=A0A8J7GUS5_9ACTN|nr:TetR/AcrR family transcriptional regulator [Longispora fulva]MBG6138538.1 AcrR family transcriptional regulator [Longispora fulva]GIG62356.1 hypothetical protein Lfu02_67280 [Longispora fulva]